MSRLTFDATPEELEKLERVEIARRALAEAKRSTASIRRKLKAKNAWPTVKADRNAVRATDKAANPRQPRERNKEHLGWVKQWRCVACAVRGLVAYGCDAAHFRGKGHANPGMGAKPDDRLCTPLCRACHREQHDQNETAWWAALGIDPKALAADLVTARQDGESGDAVILRHVAGRKT